MADILMHNSRGLAQHSPRQRRWHIAPPMKSEQPVKTPDLAVGQPDPSPGVAMSRIESEVRRRVCTR